MSKNKLYVSGPLNAVRIEGTINGKKKILYLFMDYHLDVQIQTECKDIRAIEFKDYLVKNFDNSKEEIDFFLEIYPTSTVKSASDVKLKYIWGIHKLFKKSFNFDPKKNIVYKSKEFSNVRLHYIDIREYLFMNTFDIFITIHNKIMDLLCSIRINIKELNNIKDAISISSSNIKFIYELIYKNSKIRKEKEKTFPSIPKKIEGLSKYIQEDIQKKIKHILNKVKVDYKNKKVQYILNNFINKELHFYFEEYFKNLNLLFNHLKKIEGKVSSSPTFLYIDKNKDPTYGLPLNEITNMLTKIYLYYDELFTNFLDISVLLVDIYFIRRFLDKDYIKSSVVYTGINHSCTYLYILIKYFDFKITHSSYLKYNHNKMEKIIKESKKVHDILHLVYPPKLYQCSDLSSFPKNFN